MTEHILYGPVQEKNLNETNESIGCMLHKSLKENRLKIAQIDAVTSEYQTYNDIFESTCLLAQNLKLMGLKNNDAISICSENRLEFVIPVVATIYIGVICAPLNPAYSKDELNHSLNITKPKLIFCSAQTLNTVCEVVKNCHFVTEIVLFDHVVPELSINCKLTSFSDLIKPLFSSIRIDDFKPETFDTNIQTAAVLCSSGTTGLPKGVKLSHSNIKIFLTSSNTRSSLNMSESDVLLGLLPFFHGYGYGMLLTSIMRSLKIVVLKKFEEELFLSTIEKYKISVLPAVPPLMVFLAKHPSVDKYDLSSLKNMFCGAAPCGADVIKDVMKRIGINSIRQAYGMTELSVAITVCPEGVDKPNSVGQLVEEAQGKVIDLTTGKSVGPNSVGELCFRGPQVMQGYFNNEEATRETIDKDGWLHTGDIGYYDNDGFFYVVDRLKELIKYKGYQVAPAELEALLLTHPDVKDVAVIGVPDEKCGELPMAYIVKQPGSVVSKNNITDYVKSKVSAQKWLWGGVEFIDTIPKNPSGKILRRVLRSSLKSKL